MRTQRHEFARVVGDSLDAVDHCDSWENAVLSEAFPDCAGKLTLFRLTDVCDLKSSGVYSGASSHWREHWNASLLTESKELYFGLDVVDAVNHEIRRPIERKGRGISLKEQTLGFLSREECFDRLDHSGGKNGFDVSSDTLSLGDAHVRARGESVAIEGGKGNAIEVNHSDSGNPRASEEGNTVGAHSSQSHYHDIALPNLILSVLSEELVVPDQLLLNQFFWVKREWRWGLGPGSSGGKSPENWDTGRSESECCCVFNHFNKRFQICEGILAQVRVKWRFSFHLLNQSTNGIWRISRVFLK